MSDEAKPFVERALRPAVVATLVFALWALVWPFAARPGSPTMADVGQWLSGVLQPVAMFWFVMAFLLQHQELQLQRKELAETRGELKRQADSSSANVLALKRSVFLQVTQQFYNLMDRAVAPTQALLQPYNNAFALDSDNALERTSAMIAGSLHNRADPKFPVSQLTEHFQSTEGCEQATAYVSTMSQLLSLANECDDGQVAVFTDLVRTTPYFGWYCVLLRLYPNLQAHDAALGRRPNDHRMRLWEERDYGLLMGSEG